MEDASLFPELMWQRLQTRPLVLAFRGPQGREPRAAWSPGQQQGGQKPQLTGLDSGNMGEEGVPSPWEPAPPRRSSLWAPRSTRSPAGPLEWHLAGPQRRPLSREGQTVDRPCPLVCPEPPPETLLIILAVGSPV